MKRAHEQGDAVTSLKQDMLDDMRMAVALAKESAPHGHVPLIAPFFAEIRHIRSRSLGVYNDLRREVLDDLPKVTPA